VEFGASLGISTIHLAAGLKDRGRGSLITTEIHPVKASALSANLSEAGLGEIVEARLGDALETLRSLPGPVDLLCLDGWNELHLPVLQLVAPHLSPDALVIADLSAGDPDARARHWRLSLSSQASRSRSLHLARESSRTTSTA